MRGGKPVSNAGKRTVMRGEANQSQARENALSCEGRQISFKSNDRHLNNTSVTNLYKLLAVHLVPSEKEFSKPITIQYFNLTLPLRGFSVTINYPYKLQF